MSPFWILLELRMTEVVGDSLPLCFNGHFPGEPELAGVYWSKGWWRRWWLLDYWSPKPCKAPVKSSPPTNQHPVFYRPDALPVAQPTVSKHWRESDCSYKTCFSQIVTVNKPTPITTGRTPFLSPINSVTKLKENWNTIQTRL